DLKAQLQQPLAASPPPAFPQTAPALTDAPASQPPLPAPESGALPRLPLHFTRFFGRETEIESLLAMFSIAEQEAGGGCLITLTGLGGTGKTRLALEVAQRVADRERMPVWFVPLAEVGDAAQVPDAIRKALNLSASLADPLEQAASVLNRRSALL